VDGIGEHWVGPDYNRCPYYMASYQIGVLLLSRKRLVKSSNRWLEAKEKGGMGYLEKT